MNPWVIHTDAKIWGQDVHEFRPERWLVEKERLAILDQHSLAVSKLHSRAVSNENIALI